MKPEVLDDALAPLRMREPRSLVHRLNAFAIIVAALYFGHELFVTLILAGLLAFVLAPACVLLQRVGLPRAIGVIVAVLVAFAVIGGIGLVVGREAADLAAGVPAFEGTIMTKWHGLASSGGLTGRLIGSLPAQGGAAGPAAMFGLTGDSTLTLARTLAQPLLGPIATVGVVLIFTIFILLYTEDLRDRLVRLVGRRDLHRTILAMNDAAARLSRYFLFQLAMNTGFGAFIGLSLWSAGLPNPLLWGILAGLMRFVPFIGTFIAVAPPLLLALAAVPGWSLAVVVLVLFAAGELVMSQIVEPLIYGHSTGLSPLAVILATAFWAFLWGPVGLLLATPLSVCLVVIGRHVESLAFFDIILGNASPLEAAETFYQRALEGHAAALAPAARRRIGETSLAEYYDTVALPGLALAQGDLARDALAFERLEAIHAQIETLLKLVAARPAAGVGAPGPVPAAWRQPGALLVIPGRGQLDDLAGDMALQVLKAAGFGVQSLPNAALGASSASGLDEAAVRLCCLSVLEEGSTVSGIRYFMRRIQKRMPQAAIAVGLWHVDGASQLLADLRAEGREEHVVLSIGELVTLTQALAARAG